jgi:hypothetical protein
MRKLFRKGVAAAVCCEGEEGAPIKLTTWASEALPEEALKTLRPWIRQLRKADVTGTMVGVEFITRRIAPLQDHRRSIWVHRAGDDIRLHTSELNADAR